jgi:hypothetical protein
MSNPSEEISDDDLQQLTEEGDILRLCDQVEEFKRLLGDYIRDLRREHREGEEWKGDAG